MAELVKKIECNKKHTYTFLFDNKDWDWPDSWNLRVPFRESSMMGLREHVSVEDCSVIEIEPDSVYRIYADLDFMEDYDPFDGHQVWHVVRNYNPVSPIEVMAADGEGTYPVHICFPSHILKKLGYELGDSVNMTYFEYINKARYLEITKND